MVVMVSQHHFTGRPCWSWLSWFICLSSRLWARALPTRSRASGEGSTARRCGVKEVQRPGSSCCAATRTSSPCLASSRVGGPHKAGRRSARRWASGLSRIPWCVATPHSDARGSELMGSPPWSSPSAGAVWSCYWREPVNARRTACEGMASRRGAPGASVWCESPGVLRRVWHAHRGPASARKCLINA